MKTDSDPSLPRNDDPTADSITSSDVEASRSDPAIVPAVHSNGTTTDLKPSPKQVRPDRDPGFFARENIIVNFVVPILLLLAAAGVMLAFGTIEPEKRKLADGTREGKLRALPPVEIHPLVSLEDAGANLSLDVDGTVVPFQEAQVAAEVSGRVIEKTSKCEAGQYVSRGDLLMKIDSTDYELEVERLTRQKEQEYQALKEIDQEMVNTRKLIDVAKQDVRLQQAELDRQKSMPKGFASKGDIDRARRGVLASSQQLLANENQIDLLKQRRIRLEASERLAATQLRGAETNLARTEIRAPIEGVIVNEVADVNTFVNRGSTLVVIDDTSKVEVTSSLRMDQLYWVLDQSKPMLDQNSRGYDLPETPAVIEYELSGRDNVVYRWNGRLLSYNGIGVDSETRTVPVRVVVDDPRMTLDEDGTPTLDASAPALVRGMYVRVRLLIKPQTKLVVIPAQALQPGNRVYQFVEDESVLETKEEEKDSGDEKEEKSDDGDPDDESDGEPEPDQIEFNPEDWKPGRVVVRRGITPLDSINVDQSKSNSGSTSNSISSDERLWVCEVADETLVEGSLVVVSPIGTISGDSMPARAKVENNDAETDE